MKIGIPKALVYYYYFPVWKTIFEELGCSVVVSDNTAPDIVEKGVKVTVSEICVPIKIFNGHIINLLEKGVDYIFVPRLVQFENNEWFCPKFLSLPDLVRFSVSEIENKIIDLEIRCKREDMCTVKAYLPLMSILGVSHHQVSKAVKKAREEFKRFREICFKGYALDEAIDIYLGKKIAPPSKNSDLTIGVMGYVYNIYDNFVSMEIVRRLRDMGVRVITFDMLRDEDTHNLKENTTKNLFWVFTRKIYNVAELLLKREDVDGLIHVTAFACGPDSVLGKLLEMDSEEAKKPFMTIRVDEHTGESHVQTRIEAYVDMLKRKKGKA